MVQRRVGRSVFVRGFFHISQRTVPFLIVPIALAAMATFTAFRHAAVITLPADNSASPLVLPAGWPMPPIPADNPITQEKFVLGRQLFYETLFSQDSSTSCASCHDVYLSFASHGPHVGALRDSARPFRVVPRLINLAYDTVLMWDGHFHTLEEQVRGPLLKRGELNLDTNEAINRLASNSAYTALFTRAFGDGTITFDRVAKAIATFERCLISGNSPYDQYLNGNTSLMSQSAIRGMNLFFDTTQTNCSNCHNSLGTGKPNAAGQIFSDNNYYRTGTFENAALPNGGYGFDTTQDTFRFLDAGRAGITRDSSDIGKFRTPTLRNAMLMTSLGADGTITSVSQLLQNYNGGGVSTDGGRTFQHVFNQDPRIKPLHLTDTQVNDLATFLGSLTDVSFISNPAFGDPGEASVQIDDRAVAGNLSIYPNPAVGFVNVESPDLTGLTEARLISEKGATVWQQGATANGRMHLDFTGVPNGTYRLQVQSGDTRKAVNIVIKK